MSGLILAINPSCLHCLILTLLCVDHFLPSTPPLCLCLLISATWDIADVGLKTLVKRNGSLPQTECFVTHTLRFQRLIALPDMGICHPFWFLQITSVWCCFVPSVVVLRMSVDLLIDSDYKFVVVAMELVGLQNVYFGNTWLLIFAARFLRKLIGLSGDKLLFAFLEVCDVCVFNSNKHPLSSNFTQLLLFSATFFRIYSSRVFFVIPSVVYYQMIIFRSKSA